MRKMAVVIVVGLLVAAGAVGCKSRPKTSQTPMTGAAQEPLWVSKGVNAFPDQMGKAFYGVGLAEARMIPSKALRRLTAINRARDEVAGQIRTMVASVFKDYSEAVFTQSMDQGEMQAVTSNVQKSVVDEVLYGAEVQDMWTHPSSDDYYALVRVGSDGVAKQLRDKVIAAEKDRLKVDAAAAHKELDQIIEKYRALPPPQ